LGHIKVKSSLSRLQFDNLDAAIFSFATGRGVGLRNLQVLNLFLIGYISHGCFLIVLLAVVGPKLQLV